MTIKLMRNHQEFNEHICIVGAGLVGSLLSILLANRGYAVDLIEKRPDMRKADIPGGRTIAMSISHRGWHALEKVGLKDKILPKTMPKASRLVHLGGEKTIKQDYGRNGQAIYTINRKLLNSELLNKAESTGRVRIHFNSECAKINYDTCEVDIYNKKSEETKSIKYDRIIGADGIFSQVAKGLTLSDSKSEYIRFSPDYGYKELVISPDEKNNWKLKNDVVHVWPRRHFNLVALPNFNKTFTCTLFLKLTGETSLNSLANHSELSSFFEKYFPDVIELIPDYSDQFINNPISKIYSLKCTPWNYENKVLLIGDACHAIAPFYAMGMNVGFEDCSVFDDFMTKKNNNLDEVFVQFSRDRKLDTDAIADLSLQNFIALGNSDVPDYHLKWMLNRKLWEKYNDGWMPLYPMIAFSHIPFREILEINKKQSEIINNIITNEEIPSNFSDDWLEFIYIKYIQPVHLSQSVNIKEAINSNPV